MKNALLGLICLVFFGGCSATNISRGGGMTLAPLAVEVYNNTNQPLVLSVVGSETATAESQEALTVEHRSRREELVLRVTIGSRVVTRRYCPSYYGSIRESWVIEPSTFSGSPELGPAGCRLEPSWRELTYGHNQPSVSVFVGKGHRHPWGWGW